MGEAEFGLIDGVISTRAGFIGSVEVAEVIFDPRLVSFDQLAAQARDRSCAQPIFARSDRQFDIAGKLGRVKVERSDAPLRDVKDDKYYLSGSPMRFVPMTQAQRTRVNARVSAGREQLSPRQLEFLALIEKHPKAGWKEPQGLDLGRDWDAARAVAKKLQPEPGPQSEDDR